MPSFGKKHIIEEVEIQTFVLQKLEQGLGQKTIKDILIVLKMILKFGSKFNWIEHKTFDIQYPTLRTKQTLEILSRSNQKKLMEHIETHFTFRNLGIYICLSTGIRIGEVCALTWEDVENGVIKVNKTIQRIYTIEENIRKTELILDSPKTKNSIREIPISSHLLKMLKPIKKIVNNSFLFLPMKQNQQNQEPTEVFIKI